MKKSYLFLLLSSLIVASPAAVSAGTISLTDNRTVEETAPAATFEESDFEIEEYLYDNSYGSVAYYVVITNNSEASVSVVGNGNALDAEGKILGSNNLYIDIIGPGETSIGYFWFSDVEGVDKVEYTLEYEAEDYYKPVINNLTFDAAVNNTNVTITATNEGEYRAQYIEVYALFLDAEGKVVDTDSVYLTDNDGEIKVGASISGQLDTSEEFADVKLFVRGSSDGEASAEPTFDASQIEVTERVYESSYATADYLVIKNNSDEILVVSGNGLAKDASGNTIGAANMSIDVLGPGEESIGYFYFSDVTGVETVEYNLFYDTDSYYEPVIKDLSVEASINEKNVVAVVTNNGSKAAEFVEVYCVFLDADDNVVDVDSAYVIDNDSEIKPGASLSGQLNTYDAFDHVEVYLTGRASK